MTGSHITNNIRLVLDIFDYSELIEDESLILFLDFYKAFDSLQHKFLFKALDVFGFGDLFKHYIQVRTVRSNFHLALPKDLTFIVGSVKAVCFGQICSFYPCNYFLFVIKLVQ